MHPLRQHIEKRLHILLVPENEDGGIPLHAGDHIFKIEPFDEIGSVLFKTHALLCLSRVTFDSISYTPTVFLFESTVMETASYFRS